MLDSSKKYKILLASLEEFSERGYEKASTDRICQKADVSKGLIFHHFGSKDNLYMATMNKCIDDILVEFNNININDNDIVSILMKLNSIKYNFFSKNPMHYKLLKDGFYNTPKKLKKELGERYMDIKKISFNIILDIIKDLPLKKGVEAENVISLIAAITSIIENKYLPYLMKENADFDEFYDAANEEFMKLMNMMLYGILTDRIEVNI